jgi:hypothetical protein
MACIFLRERAVNARTGAPFPGVRKDGEKRQTVDGRRPYWTEREWRRIGKKEYIGKYRVGDAWWWGWARQKRNGVFEAEIINAPASIMNVCFVPKGRAVCEVHFHVPKPKTLDGVIRGVENKIEETIEENRDALLF